MAGNYRIKIEPILDTAKLNKQLNETKQLKLNGAGTNAGNSFANSFARAIKERFKYSIANAVIYGTQNAIKDMVENVKELDAAQTELKKVTDLSGKSLEKYTKQAYDMSGAVAKTGTELISASSEFAKQGFDTDTALKLSEVASVFQNIADTEIDAATAAKFINSQLKAFGDTDYFSKFNTDAEKATAVIDATNEVANNFGVGTNDLQAALTKTGAAMQGYGNTFSNTIALITAGTEMLPNQASKVARGWRTIGANILKLSQDADSFTAANDKVNISLRDSQGNMKSTYDVLTDLYNGVKGQSVAWDKLSEEEKSAISLQLAGKTQTEVFMSTMNNFSQAIEANATALNSQGSAAKENAKYLDSIEGKTQAFQSAWEKLSYDFMNSDFLKTVIDFGTKLITVLDNLITRTGITAPKALAVLGSAFGTISIAKIITGLDNTINAFKNLTKGAETAVTAVEAVGEASEVATGVGGLSKLKSIIGYLSNPLVIGGIAALAVAIASIEIDKYFSLENSIKRLNEYQGQLEDVSSEIEELQQKRSSDDGLTRAESIHLDVLRAEERSLERQVELEKQRVQNAFIKDTSTNRKGRVGLEETNNFQDSRNAELEYYKQLEAKQEEIKHAQQNLSYALMTGDEARADRYRDVLQVLDSEEQKIYDKLTKVQSHSADAASELATYFETAVNSVDYDSLNAEQQAAFDDMHKAFLQSKLDVGTLGSEYEDFVTIINSAVDSLGYDSIDIFSGIDFSQITTLNDLITAIKDNIKELDGDNEISFKVKDKDGGIETITKKISELTDKDIQSIISFNADTKEAEKEKKEVTKTEKADIEFTDNDTLDTLDNKKQLVVDPVTGIISYTDSGTLNKIRSSKNEATKSKTVQLNFVSVGLSAIKRAWNALKSSIGFAHGKRKGEEGGLAWLGDEGSRANPKPELVVSDNGKAYLAGTTGWEMYPVKASDTVYTYSQTKKLLGGKQTISGFSGVMPRYASGKKSTKKKKQEKFEKELKKLEHKRKVQHWTDAKFQKEYKKLYNKYKKWLTKDQKWSYTESREDYQNERATDKFEELAEDIITESDLTSFIDKVNASKNLSADEKSELINNAQHQYYSNVFDRQLGVLSARGDVNGSLADFIAQVNANSAFSESEKAEYAKKAYENVAKYNLQAYKDGVKTREEALKSIQEYYEQVGEYDEAYYEMLDDLREADKAKEIERLQDLQEYHDNSLSLAQKYIQKELNAVNKKIAAEEEEADQLERLTELNKELAKARSTKVRVYREGIGFVYERDTEAIEEAEKALLDYQKSLNKSELEEYADHLQELLDLFDELSDAADIKELEVALGLSDFTSLTGTTLENTDISTLTEWIKTQLASSLGYADLIEQLQDIATSEIDSYLDSNGGTTVSESLIAKLKAKYGFASGTLSVPRTGLSVVGEEGAEIRMLNKGDTIFDATRSRNLMDWGNYSPAQVARALEKNTSSQVFNFDKIVLPNVHNAEDFYRELQNLPNQALQQSLRRA